MLELFESYGELNWGRLVLNEIRAFPPVTLAGAALLTTAVGEVKFVLEATVLLLLLSLLLLLLLLLLESKFWSKGFGSKNSENRLHHWLRYSYCCY